MVGLEGITEWLRHHDLDPDDVTEVVISPSEARNGCMRVRVRARDDEGEIMVGDDEVLTEERVMAIRSFPVQIKHQETVW